MELIWNKTPNGRRFIHTAAIVGDFKFCITMNDGEYMLCVHPDTIEQSEYKLFDTLKQAKAEARDLVADGSVAWLSMVTPAQRLEYLATNPGALPPEHLNCRSVVLPATSAVVPIPLDQWELSDDAAALEACKFCGFLTSSPCDVPPADYCEQMANRKALSSNMYPADALAQVKLGFLNNPANQRFPVASPAKILEDIKATEAIVKRGALRYFEDARTSDLALAKMYGPITKRVIWAWPTRGAYVERGIVNSRERANIKRTMAKQTGNARVLVSRNKREGKYLLDGVRWDYQHVEGWGMAEYLMDGFKRAGRPKPAPAHMSNGEAP